VDERVRWAGAPAPAHLALSLLAAALLPLSTGPVNDLDLAWHVQLGRQILHRHTLTALGTEWLGVPAPHWVTSQWLSEVGYAALVDLGGWHAVLWLRLACLLATGITLALTLLHHRSSLLVAPVAGLAMLALALGTQDRPQTLSFLFLVLLGHWAVRLWQAGTRPRAWLLAVVCLLWAQLHGLWILAPAAFGLLAVGLLAEGRRRDRAAVRAAAVCLLASLSGLVNPHGAAAFLLPLRFRAATPLIVEWQPSTVRQLPTVVLLLLVAMIVLAWAAGPRTPRRVELVWVFAWLLFGLLAARNVVPAVLLLAPAAAGAVDRTWGGRAAHWTRPSSVRESRLLGAGVAVTLLAGVLLAGQQTATARPLSRLPAVRIAGWLAHQPGPVRVFNHYNVSGSLIAFGGGRVRLVVDGRADQWGDRYLRRQTDAVQLGPGWRSTFESFHPEAAVLPDSSPLAQLLLDEGTWRVQLREGHYLLLLPARPDRPTGAPGGPQRTPPPGTLPRLP
jgi:hypothetical protein